MRYEFRPHQIRYGAPQLIKFSEQYGKNGFISLFGFPEPVTQLIQKQRGTFGLATTKLYSAMVYLDFDNADEAARASERWLRDRSIIYALYNTGNRGWHVHIPIVPLYEIGVVERIKEFVGKTFPGADMGIYKSSGIIRIPGTQHAKTGHRKVQVRCNLQGTLLSVPVATRQTPVYQYDAEDGHAGVKLDQAMMLFGIQGEMKNTAYKIAGYAKKAGKDSHEASELLHLWSNTMCPSPLKDFEISGIITSAFRLRG